MTAVIPIGTVAIIVTIVGCIVIWLTDVTRAGEVDDQPAASRPPSAAPLQAGRPLGHAL